MITNKRKRIVSDMSELCRKLTTILIRLVLILTLELGRLLWREFQNTYIELRKYLRDRFNN